MNRDSLLRSVANLQDYMSAEEKQDLHIVAEALTDDAAAAEFDDLACNACGEYRQTVAELHSQVEAMKTVADAAADTANKEAMAFVAFRQTVAEALAALRESVKADKFQTATFDWQSNWNKGIDAALNKIDATIAALGLAAKEK